MKMNDPKESLEKLSDEQLKGAEFMCRYLYTSPAIKGRGAEVLAQVQQVCLDLMKERNSKNK